MTATPRVMWIKSASYVRTLLNLNMLQLHNKHLSKTVNKLLANQFGITNFMGEESDINFYTSFPNYQTLLDFYNFLNQGENGENIVYITSDELEFPAFPANASNRENKPGRRRKPSTLDEVFIVLIRMTLGLFELDLAHRFRVHASTVNRICISWINFLYLKFGHLNI